MVLRAYAGDAALAPRRFPRTFMLRHAAAWVGSPSCSVGGSGSRMEGNIEQGASEEAWRTPHSDSSGSELSGFGSFGLWSKPDAHPKRISINLLRIVY